jgi:hypothetical protein
MACDPMSYENTTANRNEVKYNGDNLCKKYRYKLTTCLLQTHIGGYIGLQTYSATSRIMLMNKMLLLSHLEHLLSQKHLWIEVSTCYNNLF